MTSHRATTPSRRRSAADLRNNRKEFVERLAVAHEVDGLCRIAGRIFGLLLLCEREMSLDEITSELGASKGSASVNTRLLEQRGLIERVSKPGDRRDYYRIMPDLFERTMEQRLARWHRFGEIVTYGLAELDLSPAVRNRLMDFETQQENVREVIETALEKWRSRRKRIMRSRLGATIIAMLALTGARAEAQQPATSLTLGDAARLAARQSAPSLSAQLRAREAAARVIQKRADLLPTLSAAALQSGHTLHSATFGIDFPTPAGEKPLFDPNGQVIGPVNTLDMRARVTVPGIDFAARERLSGARIAARASDAAAQSAGEEAAANAAVAYLRAARADAILSARAADSVLADSLVGIARDQLTAGVGVALDVTRAQSQLAGVHAQLIAARGEQARARLELVRALGAPLDAPIALASSLDAMPVSDTVVSESAAVALALRERPDLLAAQLALDEGRQNVRAIRAERLPTLSAFGDDGAIGTTPAHLLNTYNWGVQLSVPILDGFRRQGRLSEQNAVAAGLEIQRRELERQVAVEVRSAILDLATARDQVDAARERLRLAQQEYSQAQDRFRAGVAGNADVVTASLSLNAARNLVIDALASYQSARVALARAQGTTTALP